MKYLYIISLFTLLFSFPVYCKPQSYQEENHIFHELRSHFKNAIQPIFADLNADYVCKVVYGVKDSSRSTDYDTTMTLSFDLYNNYIEVSGDKNIIFDKVLYSFNGMELISYQFKWKPVRYTTYTTSMARVHYWQAIRITSDGFLVIETSSNSGDHNDDSVHPIAEVSTEYKNGVYVYSYSICKKH